MTPPNDNYIHQQIGNLTAKVDMLIEATRRSDEKSVLSRASVRRRMNEKRFMVEGDAVPVMASTQAAFIGPGHDLECSRYEDIIFTNSREVMRELE